MARQVYAHYMVGLTDGQSLSQWQKDINDAKSTGIDGFALNIGPSDTWTLTQLHQGYAAAEAANFKLFLSFDMNDGYWWATQQVIDLVNTFKNSGAQVKVDGRPLVNTFEGSKWADNWGAVRSGTGGVYLVPNWSSLGPYGVRDRLGQIDGAFYWGAWPRANEQKISPEEDRIYMNVLGSKPYMMGVSPHFYTNLPEWNKNWYSSSESLWYDRWQQALDLLPNSIQIITWNDYGESSYVGDMVDRQVIPNAVKYVKGFDHAAYRAALPYFIKAYKAGNRQVDLPSGPTALAWYRTTPARQGWDGGTVWGQGGTQSAANGARDVVSIMTITVDNVDIQACIGSSCQTWRTDGSKRANYFEMPFNGRTGAVKLTMNGRSTTGVGITNSLPATGYVNFNSVAIRL